MQKLDKDEIALLQKPWVKNHTTLKNEHILELYRLFNLYCDPRTKRIDLKDVLITASQLGLMKQSPIVANTLQQVSDQHGDGGVDFEEFVRELTSKLVVSLILQQYFLQITIQIYYYLTVVLAMKIIHSASNFYQVLQQIVLSFHF